MPIARDITELVAAHRSPPKGMEFHECLGPVLCDTNLLGYVSVIERAWREMALDGVLCMDGRPILYLKEFDLPSSFLERRTLQRLFWNQGVANVLVLADPTSVYIYSGLTKPSDEQDEEADEHVLVERLSYASYVEQIQSLYHGLWTGHYYEMNSASFDPSQAVDSCLMDNLRALRDKLTTESEALDTKTAHAIIGRVLFLCYLLDRGIISVGEIDRGCTGTMLFSEILERKPPDLRIDYLYDFFANLKEEFNGNMFDQDLDAEKLRIKPSHLKTLTLFLGGHQVGTGQRTMFWPYDFRMIPVETISAIYQDFLAAEDPKQQGESGAYYTPRFLAEMVVDVAVRDNPAAFGWSYLDPACGSGVFLVILFNRLANRWLHSQDGPVDYLAKAEALQGILREQIWGVDIQETACRIACFSLYLAYLDYFDPPDIRAYREKTGKPLPKLLEYGEGSDWPQADIPVVYKGDFLAGETLSGRSYDCVVGNPPWEGRQSKQLAQKFMQQAPLSLRTGGTGCLLLPSKILQNQTDAFQAEWLRQVSLERVFQLADYRFLLFQDAKCPAFIALFRNSPPQLTRHMVEFVAPKFDRAGLRRGVITVNPASRTWIPLSDIFAATRSRSAPVVWKRRLWGTSRDQKLLDLLQAMPSLREMVDVYSQLKKRGASRTKRWVTGQGIKPWLEEKPESKSDRDLKANAWPLDTPFVQTSPWNSDLLLLPEDTISFEERLEKKKYRKDVLYSQPPSDLFRNPMVLISQGFDKVAFCNFDALFQDSLQSISGPTEDTDLLMFLTAYLRSDLARYLLFHTSANWGTERKKVQLFELLRIPFPLPDDESAPPEAAQIVSEVVARMKTLQLNLQEKLGNYDRIFMGGAAFGKPGRNINRKWREERRKLIDTFQAELEPLFRGYFGLTEQEATLIEDTIRIFEPSSTPTTRRSDKTVTLDSVEKSKVAPYAAQGLAAYADTLTKTLNSWAEAEGSTYRVWAEGGTDEQTGLAMVTLKLSKAQAPYRMKTLSKPLGEALNEVYASSSIIVGTMFYERDVMIVFHGGEVHIVRPNILLNWTRTAALNDAARIYGEVALARGER